MLRNIDTGVVLSVVVTIAIVLWMGTLAVTIALATQASYDAERDVMQITLQFLLFAVSFLVARNLFGAPSFANFFRSRLTALIALLFLIAFAPGLVLVVSGAEYPRSIFHTGQVGFEEALIVQSVAAVLAAGTLIVGFIHWMSDVPAGRCHDIIDVPFFLFAAASGVIITVGYASFSVTWDTALGPASDGHALSKTIVLLAMAAMCLYPSLNKTRFDDWSDYRLHSSIILGVTALVMIGTGAGAIYRFLGKPLTFRFEELPISYDLAITLQAGAFSVAAVLFTLSGLNWMNSRPPTLY